MTLQNKHFVAVNISRYLTNGLVGKPEESVTAARNSVKRLPLTQDPGRLYSPMAVCTPGRLARGAGTPGKNQRPQLVPSRYLVVRVFEVFGSNRNLFRLIHSVQVKTRAETFMRVRSTQFLCRIQTEPTLSSSRDVLLSEDDWSTFKKLAGDTNRRRTLATAVQNLNTAHRKRGNQ